MGFRNISDNARRYYAPMPVTKETILDFNIDEEEVRYTKIGNKLSKALMVPVTEEVYYEYMRHEWREDKREQRKEQDLSLNQLLEDYDLDFEDTDNSEDIQQSLEQAELYSRLYRSIENINEPGKTIIQLLLKDKTEKEIAEIIGISQSSVNKKKKEAYKYLQKELKTYYG